MPALETERLILRPVPPEDGQWQIWRRDTAELIGACLLVAQAMPPAIYTGYYGLPADHGLGPVETVMGWALARHQRGYGFAAEAAQAVLTHGWERLGLTRVLACSVWDNLRSLAVMRRLGLRVLSPPGSPGVLALAVRPEPPQAGG